MPVKLVLCPGCRLLWLYVDDNDAPVEKCRMCAFKTDRCRARLSMCRIGSAPRRKPETLAMDGHRGIAS